MLLLLQVAQLLNELRQLGAATFPRPLPGCEDVVCVHPRKAAEGLQQTNEIDVAACLAADPYLLVYEGIDALAHMLRYVPVRVLQRFLTERVLAVVQ